MKIALLLDPEAFTRNKKVGPFNLPSEPLRYWENPPSTKNQALRFLNVSIDASKIEKELG